VLEHRQRAVQEPGALGEPVEEVWEDDAVATLYASYAGRSGRSLRWMVQLAHLSLALACDAAAPRIGRRHVEAGLRELTP
jgi:hypothetical protein